MKKVTDRYKVAYLFNSGYADYHQAENLECSRRVYEYLAGSFGVVGAVTGLGTAFTFTDFLKMQGNSFEPFKSSSDVNFAEDNNVFSVQINEAINNQRPEFKSEHQINTLEDGQFHAPSIFIPEVNKTINVQQLNTETAALIHDRTNELAEKSLIGGGVSTVFLSAALAFAVLAKARSKNIDELYQKNKLPAHAFGPGHT